MPDWSASLSQPRQQPANLALPGLGTSRGQARQGDNRFSWSAYLHQAVWEASELERVGSKGAVPTLQEPEDCHIRRTTSALDTLQGTLRSGLGIILVLLWSSHFIATDKEAQRQARKWGCQDFGPGFSDSRIQDCAQRVEPQHSVRGTSWGGRAPWPSVAGGRGLLDDKALADLEDLARVAVHGSRDPRHTPRAESARALREDSDAGRRGH